MPSDSPRSAGDPCTHLLPSRTAQPWSSSCPCRPPHWPACLHQCRQACTTPPHLPLSGQAVRNTTPLPSIQGSLLAAASLAWPPRSAAPLCLLQLPPQGLTQSLCGAPGRLSPALAGRRLSKAAPRKTPCFPPRRASALQPSRPHSLVRPPPACSRCRHLCGRKTVWWSRQDTPSDTPSLLQRWVELTSPPSVPSR